MADILCVYVYFVYCEEKIDDECVVDDVDEIFTSFFKNKAKLKS